MSTNLVDKDTGELITLANGTRIWCGTKTAHDLAVQQGTMPNNCMVCITDDAAGEEAWEYSTSETNTGKKWIDGKPIYRRVLKATSAATISATWHSVIGITDVFNSIKSNIETISEARFFADIASSTSLNRLEFRSSDGQLQIMVSSASAITIQQLSLVIEYTKTTD